MNYNLDQSPIFYVYVYLDPRKPGNYVYREYKFDYEPFYVGKGKDNRMYIHLETKEKSYKGNKIRKILKENLSPIILKIKDELYEQQAYDLEIDLINKIGMFCLKQGPLTNLTEGGTGGNKLIGKTDEEMFLLKNKISNSIKNWHKINHEYFKKVFDKGNETRKRKYKTGELKGSFFGKNHNYKTIKLMQETAKLDKRGQKENNSQYGTCWITKEGINRKIKKKDINNWIVEGWSKGRFIDDKFIKFGNISSCLDKIYVNNKILNKVISKEELELWLKKGWEKGRYIDKNNLGQ